ncbi:TPA: glycosyltransferase family 2 protein [Candidatus Pacearchaeota archaeon]|jgi:glycosyltransferase involved in cell wall biosynthesis|nr:glycosyltransferase family 2 protein [Candidatus Pacearchaeota archaeon]
MKNNLLSIIVPVYNEEKTLKKIIDKVQKVNLNPIKKEIIIVNDYSSDNTKEVILELKNNYSNIKLIEHKKNLGKGAAIRTGLKNISGDYITIQDGDLEYNPNDFKKLLNPILKGKTEVVYGSRLMGNVKGFNIPSHYYGNKLLSLLTGILYGKKITDMETCYKLFTKKAISKIELKSNKFDIEPEITSKFLKNKEKILELPIDYNCRSFEEGKKITWKDGIIAIYTILKYRFSN